MSKTKKAICPRFMIAENPMAEYGVEYIYHTQQPRFLAKKVEDNPLSGFELVDDIDNMSEFFKNDPSKIAGLMRRLGDWWSAYIKWEDNNE